MRKIVVVDYDPEWPNIFKRLRDRIWPVLQDFAISIEHVGSTSVPGLAAKPIIDISAIVPSNHEIPLAIKRLSTIGYAHLGNLGIEGREAFKHDPSDDSPAYHFYVCPQGSLGLTNHLVFRNYLRSHPEVAQEYGNLKKQLSDKFPHDIDRYIEGKTDFIVRALKEQGISLDNLTSIDRSNRLP
ncbi:MAG: GrpB family protein [Cyanobacteria bacterium P01_D01_bin.156]